MSGDRSIGQQQVGSLRSSAPNDQSKNTAVKTARDVTQMVALEPLTRPEYAQSRTLPPGVELAPKRVPAMSEDHTFGPRLRSERERRGISIDTIVTVTK